MILELLQSRVDTHDDLDWLKRALQAAVELEFFTLPPYLTAMWSIKDQSHYATKTIREVLYEEMEHMALACNMLVAIGGTPVINRPPAIPEYPRPMPGGVQPELTIGLTGLTRESIEVFKKIEAPEKPITFEDRRSGFESLGQTFPRIGVFYDAIWEKFEKIKPLIRSDNQISGPLAPLTMTNLEDVQAAIHRIQSQGEGTSIDPNDPSSQQEGDLAHYYRFDEIAKERRLEFDRQQGKYVWGATISFPDVFPIAQIPIGGHRYTEVPTSVATLLLQFDQQYSRMLDHLHSAWNGGGQASFYLAVECMFSLQEHARALMAIPIEGMQSNYGPNFRYIS